MEELIFFAVIIFFSIVDSIARSRKKKQQRSAPGQETRIPEEWEWEEELPTSDADGPYEDSYEIEEPEVSTPSSRGSSEGMIPADIWEEIAGLAQGRTQPPKPPPPPAEVEPAWRRPVEVEPVRARRVDVQRGPARPVQMHRVHRAHAGYGTDPSSRPRSEQDGLDPLARTLSADASAVRRQLQSHHRSALRRAIILHEVLGPPAADRPERFGE